MRKITPLVKFAICFIFFGCGRINNASVSNITRPPSEPSVDITIEFNATRPPSTISVDVSPEMSPHLVFDDKYDGWLGNYVFYQGTLEDSTIVMSASRDVVEKYLSSESVSGITVDDLFYIISKSNSTDDEEEIIQSAIERFYGEADEITFWDEIDFYLSNNGRDLVSVNATVKGSTDIKLSTSSGREIVDFNLEATGVRLQDGSYGVVIGVLWGNFAELNIVREICETLSSLETPYPDQELIEERVANIALDIVNIGDFQEVISQANLESIYQTFGLNVYDFEVSYPKPWVVTQDERKWVLLGTNENAISTFLSNTTLGADDYVAKIYVEKYPSSFSQSDLPPTSVFLDSKIRTMMAVNDSVEATTVYASSEEGYSSLAYAPTLSQNYRGVIAAVEQPFSHIYVEVYSSSGQNLEDMIGIALGIINSIKPLTITFRDRIVLTNYFTATSLTSIFSSSTFHFQYPDEWESQGYIPGQGGVIIFPEGSNQDNAIASITVEILPVSFKTSAGAMEYVDIGLGDFLETRGFILGEKIAAARRGFSVEGGEIFQLVVNLGTGQTALIVARTSKEMPLDDIEELVLAISETITID